MTAPILLTADVETYYDADYSLRKMTTAEYLRDRRFKEHMWGVKVNDGPQKVLNPDEARQFFAAVPWDRTYLLGHNLMFDGAVLAWHHGVRPKMYVDTLGMSRALIGTVLAKHDLNSVGVYLGVGGKVGYDHGSAAALAAVKGVLNPTPSQYADLAYYCGGAPNSDIELTYAVFRALAPAFPAAEYEILDWTIRMFVDPVLELDVDRLDTYEALVRTSKAQRVADTGYPKTWFTSNDKFAALLQMHNVEPPKKWSKTTGKSTFAFSKGDLPFVTLGEEHEDMTVRDLIQTRLEVKSSIEETRAKTMANVGRTGPMPVPLAYSGALNTHRLSGCLTEDTRVLVASVLSGVNFKAIVEVRADDLVWDGEEFVAHDGVKFSGVRPIMHYDGVKATPDHVVFTEDGDELPISEAKARGARLKRCRLFSESADQVGTAPVAPQNGDITVAATFDIVNCGPRNRFMANGKQVHNSVGYNLQNMGRKSELRNCVHAPEGKVMLVADSSNIELRVALALSNDVVRLEQLRNGEDLYCHTATGVYGEVVPPPKVNGQPNPAFIDEVHKPKRLVGKVCVAEGQQVLTLRGYVAIERVRRDDMVWDGVEWVSHDGVVCNGTAGVYEYDGFTGTEDHVVFVEGGGSCSLREAWERGVSLRRSGTEVRGLGSSVHVSRESECSVHVSRLSEVLHGVDKQHALREDAAVPLVCSPTSSSALAYEATERCEEPLYEPERPRIRELRREGSGVSLHVGPGGRLVDRGEHRTPEAHGDGQGRQHSALRTRELALVYESGEQQEQADDRSADADGYEPLLSVHYCSSAAAGPDRAGHTGAGARGGGEQAQKLAEYKGEARVYDIVNAGPRNRYTVNGRLVHNCDLSLQYGAGPPAFQSMLRAMGGMLWETDRCGWAVQKWRDTHPDTTRRWDQLSRAIRTMVAGGVPENWNLTTNDGQPVFWFERDAIVLPSGLRIKYPNIRREEVEVRVGDKVEKQKKYGYTDARMGGFAFLYGGKIFENLSQALARQIVLEQTMVVNKMWPVKLSVHDELVLCGPEKEMRRLQPFVELVMRRSPEWWPGIPLDCESDIAFRYGEAK
jgi:hypothetical protein